MINKKLILPLLSLPLLVTFLAVPTQCNYTSEDATSVVEDLTALDFEYQNLEYNQSTLLTMALGDNNEVFAYFYIPDVSDDPDDIDYYSYYSVTRVNFCSSTDKDSEGEYINESTWWDLTLKSSSDDYNLYKYQIDNYTVARSNKYFRWYISEFENNFYYNMGTSHEGEVISCYTEVLYDLDHLEYVTNRIKVVTVTDKVVAFDLVYLADQTLFSQASYVAFSTDYLIEDLIKIDCGYKNSFVTGSTNCVSNGDPTIFETEFKGYSSITNPEIVDSNSQRKYVKNTSYEVNSAYWFNTFEKRTYKWDTIQKTSELENATNDVKQYEWCVHFQNNKFTAKPDSSTSPVHFYQIEAANSSYDSNYPSDYNNFSYVTDFDIFNLWFEEDGEIKQAVVIDTPMDSSGNTGGTTDPVESASSWMDNFILWFTTNMPESILYTILGAVALISIAMGLLIELPKAFAKWIFGTPRKR